MKQERVLIIMPVTHQQRYVVGCLERLLCTESPGKKIRINLLVPEGNTLSREYTNSYRKVAEVRGWDVIVTNCQMGASPASEVNRAARGWAFDYLVVMGSNLVSLDVSWLDAMTRSLRATEDLGAVFGDLVCGNIVQSVHPSEYMQSGVLVTTRRAWSDIGGFREDPPSPVSDEILYAQNLGLRGYRTSLLREACFFKPATPVEVP